MEIEHINQHHRFFQDVIALGKKHSQTLGFMPDGGFIDHARKKCIIVAHSGTELIGYLMFRLVVRYSRISIVHLCVTEESRGHGVPTKLLDELRRKYEATYMGISLSCRADYFHATELWKRYGFVCKGQVRSRSIDENYLYKWWYDFNKPDLFSGVENSTTLKVKALLDANIILKLRDNDIEFEPSQDPRSLMADWLVEEVDYFYAPELLNEITRDKNYKRAEKTRAFLQNFLVARFDIEKYKDVSNLLKSFIPGNTENDRSDRKQLATSIVAEIPYFVTLDQGILEKREEIENNFRIQVFCPHEFIIEIDQLVNKEEYSPVRLAGVTFHSISNVSKSELDIYIDQFLSKSESERKISFKNIVYGEASKINLSKIKVIKSEGKAIAFFAYKSEGTELVISFIRLSETDQKQTLFMQLVSDFINKAISKGLPSIQIQESFLSESQQSVLQRMGFNRQSTGWIKAVISKMIESYQLTDFIGDIWESNLAEEITDPVSSDEKQKILLKLERRLFPLKLLDLDIPCYIVPIKPYWAGQLFDPNISGVTLFGANPEKLWNMENVYYRHVRPINEVSPARILWYASGNKHFARSSSIVASSYLDEVMTDKPKVLFQKNKHYGIYEWKNIYELCSNDINVPIKALRFSGTEVFHNPIKLSLIRQIFVSNGRKENTFASPVKVDKNIFNQIYQIGRWGN